MYNIISMEEASSDKVTLWQVQFTEAGTSKKQIVAAEALVKDHFDLK
jgi:hypothetical protein